MVRPVVRFRHGDPASRASALVVFAAFVRGAYDRCAGCGVVEPHRFDPATVRFEAASAPCPCGGTPVPAAACDAAVRLDAPADGPIHVPTVAAWLGIGDRVVDADEPDVAASDADVETDVATRGVHDAHGAVVERIDAPATLRNLVRAHREHAQRA